MGTGAGPSNGWNGDVCPFVLRIGEALQRPQRTSPVTVRLAVASCTPGFLGTQAIEDGIREELRRCLPTSELHEGYVTSCGRRSRGRGDPRR
jgi:hypothetical protein